MRRLISIGLALALSLSVLLGEIIGATYRDTNRFAYLFTKPDGTRCLSACLLGVELENMTFEEADLTLRSHPFYISSNLETTYRYADSYEGMATYENTKLAQLEINFYAQADESHADNSFNTVAARFYTNAPTLSEIMLSLGQPSSVYMSTQETFLRCSLMNFVRGRFIYSVYLHPDSHDCFSPNQRVEVIYLNIHKPSYDKWDWLGFAPAGYYIREYGSPIDGDE